MGDWGGDWQGPSAATSSGLVIAQSAVAVSHTGDTNETILRGDDHDPTIVCDWCYQVERHAIDAAMT